MSDFADCIYCGGLVEPHLTSREVRRQGKRYIIEQVPMGICNQCGERFLRPEVAKAIDRLLQAGTPTRTAEVPVLSFTSDAA